MISEFRKSINAILYERATSPFYGTLILSWLVCNWKIPYLTFFISEKKLNENKIDYILHHYNDSTYLIWLPLTSTVLLLTLVPFITNGAYWLSLWFQQWRIKKKHHLEESERLTVEQSNKLRLEIQSKEAEFQNIIEKNEKEKNESNRLYKEAAEHFENLTKTIKTHETARKEIAEDREVQFKKVNELSERNIELTHGAIESSNELLGVQHALNEIMKELSLAKNPKLNKYIVGAWISSYHLEDFNEEFPKVGEVFYINDENYWINSEGETFECSMIHIDEEKKKLWFRKRYQDLDFFYELDYAPFRISGKEFELNSKGYTRLITFEQETSPLDIGQH